MANILNLKAAFACLTVLWFAGTPGLAAAKPNQGAPNLQLQGAGLKEKYNAGDFSAMLAEFSIESGLAEYEGDEIATLMAQTDGGARFVITLLECEDPATGAGCESAVFFTGASNAGLAYSDINDFNTTALVTRVINVPDKNLLLFGRQMFFPGGVGMENVKLILVFFLMDMDEFFTAQAGSVQSVSMRQSPTAGGKLDNKASSTPAAAAFGMPAAYKFDNVMKAAISNSWNVKFSTDE